MLNVIDLMKIKSSGNVRYEEDDELNDLVESIKKHGLLEPLVVREGKGGVYDLISGHRRYQALIRAGEIQAECNIIDVSSSEKQVVQIVENIQRKDMSAIELNDALNTAFPGKTDKVIAAAIGKPYDWVTRVREAARKVNKLYSEGCVTKEEHDTLRTGQIIGRARKMKTGDVKEISGKGFTAKLNGHTITLKFYNGEKEMELLNWIKKNK